MGQGIIRSYYTVIAKPFRVVLCDDFETKHREFLINHLRMSEKELEELQYDKFLEKVNKNQNKLGYSYIWQTPLDPDSNNCYTQAYDEQALYYCSFDDGEDFPIGYHLFKLYKGN